ncbi:hypothetical protein ACFLIM_08085 [Nonomuraea sp. M3C6]|uniref:DUF4190 domain-containing protein n=1 Tax=Nonomuraea marmarensis TaxID=3351344 RepID=A0ABW7A700_9ACTN
MTSSQDPPQGDDPRPGEGPWSQPPPYPQPPSYKQPGNQVLSIIGFVCAVVAVLFYPPVFGLAGIVLGIVGHTRGEPLGKWAAVAAGVAMILGIVLGYLVARGMSS